MSTTGRSNQQWQPSSRRNRREKKQQRTNDAARLVFYTSLGRKILKTRASMRGGEKETIRRFAIGSIRLGAKVQRWLREILFFLVSNFVRLQSSLLQFDSSPCTSPSRNVIKLLISCLNLTESNARRRVNV